MAVGGSHSGRLDRVEAEVATIRTEMGGLKADVKGLGAILGRIEQSVLRAQERDDSREERSKPNLVAVISVLITLISIIVGGAWLISGQLARQDERSEYQQRQIDRNEQRLWVGHGQGASDGYKSQPQTKV